MSRMKPYDVPHKGLRNALSQLSLLAGKTDYTNADDVAALYRLGTDVFALLTIHAKDENEVTLTELEARCPGSSLHDMDDHEQLHLTQSRLEEQLATIDQQAKAGIDATDAGAEFYLSLSEFHSVYLAHTAEEERVTQPLLLQHFTDEEMAAHRGKIMASNPPETLLTWFRFVIPAQSHKERVGLLSGFKMMAPEAFFEAGMEVIRKALSAGEFHELERALQIDKVAAM